MRACTRCLSSYLDDVEFCGIDGAALVEVDTDPLLGQTIDRYKIISKLGGGAMGNVYRGTHLALSRDFALKVLHGSLAANKTLMGRFHREARALSKVRHTNIVSVVDFITTEMGLSVLIMEFLPGRTLAELIAKEAPFMPDRAARIARQIAQGLAAAHAHGIIHRDVKPANVLVMDEGGEEIAKLVDFGVVAVEGNEEEATRLTAHGKILGTPVYMSPEQVSGDMKVTPRADLYALGIILYEMLSGAPPFAGRAIAEVLLHHVSSPVPELPPCGGVEQLAMWLLEKDPEARPADGFQFSDELDRVLAVGNPELFVARNAKDAAPLPPPARAPSRRSSSRIEAPPAPLDAAPKSRAMVWAVAGLAAAIAVGAIVMATDRPVPLVVEPIIEPAVPAPVPVTPAQPALAREDPPPPKAPSGKVTSKRPPPAKKIVEQPAKIEPVTRETLDKRLNKMLTALRGAKGEVPKNLLDDVDDRYLGLRAALSDAKNQDDLESISRRLTKLENQLDGLRYGK